MLVAAPTITMAWHQFQTDGWHNAHRSCPAPEDLVCPEAAPTAFDLLECPAGEGPRWMLA